MENREIKTNLHKNDYDRHLNIFCCYNDSDHLENNITKAMINTFDSLSIENKKNFLSQICKINLENSDYSFGLYLQAAPDKELIETIPAGRRKLMAFSPTGKSWGYRGIDAGNEKEIKKSIELSIKDFESDIDENKLKKRVDEEYKNVNDSIENRGGSIPDAWIMVFKNKEPYYCIAFENKLYDLNPFQLNNHCKKSLFLQNNNIEYVKYEEIINIFDKTEEYVANEFVRYMFILGYLNITSLAQLNTSNKDLISKYCDGEKGIIKRILDEIGDKINRKAVWHKDWAWSLKSNNEFNKEIGMQYNKEENCFELMLYCCSSQNDAKNFYKREKQFSISELLKDFLFERSFHFQDNWGKNKGDTYCSTNANCSPEQYLQFWKRNTDLIKKSTNKERKRLLSKMKENNLINDNSYNEICSLSNEYPKNYNIVPEFGFRFKWRFEEAKKLDAKGEFTNEIKNKIKRIYDTFEIEDELFD